MLDDSIQIETHLEIEAYLPSLFTSGVIEKVGSSTRIVPQPLQKKKRKCGSSSKIQKESKRWGLRSYQALSCHVVLVEDHHLIILQFFSIYNIVQGLICN